MIQVFGWTTEPTLEELEEGSGTTDQSFARFLYHEHVKDSAADYRMDIQEGTYWFAPIPMTFRWRRISRKDGPENGAVC